MSRVGDVLKLGGLATAVAGTVIGAGLGSWAVADMADQNDQLRSALAKRPPPATARPTPGPTASLRPSESPSPSREPGSGGPAEPPGVVVADRQRAPGGGSGGRGDPSGGGGGAAPAPGPTDPPGSTDPGDPPPSGDGCPAGLVRAEVTLGARICLVIGER